MTLEENAKRTMMAARNRRYIALALGAWFIFEYIMLIASTRNIMFSLLRTPLMVGTPILLFFLVWYQRKKFFPEEFGRLQGFYYSLELMFYAGLLEGFFCLILNKWIMPDNLYQMYEGMMAQYQDVQKMLENSPYTAFSGMFKESIEAVKDAPIETPINAAINLLSSDLLYGFFWGIINGLILKRRSSKEDSSQEASE